MTSLPLYEGLKIPEATVIQNQLRGILDTAERNLKLKTIAGADISLNLYSTTIYAGIIHLSFPELKPIAYSLVQGETRFPYVPGYLAFREVPALVKAWGQMTVKPDLLVVDGHGIAHPRRMGIAAHFGTLTGQPSMGCAKKILTGKFEEPPLMQDTFSPIIDKQEQIGYAYRSKFKVKPVFVSPGYGLGRENCLEVIRKCVGKYRIPEPTRLAHELVNRFRKGELKEGYYEMSTVL
ncbi:MAG: endonuclease [Bacteroidetes bacterium]|jgi:deoxyribonuclease V|nr:endonuclease [Bacteroidota bacterium]